MASNAEVLKQIGNLLKQRSSVRTRVRGSEPIGLSRRPNAPRFVTIVLAVALTVIGLAVTVHPIKPVLDLLESGNVELTRDQGWWALLASPALLVVGSFFRGI
ncbi:MAG TPA: hypothetical protein VGX28_09295 [Frankiaceae bacterium]|jgi:uncharacterized membrane protein YhaH (DUF805 family)|nr:hypothetical protein [Frankiaceae bacterium]